MRRQTICVDFDGVLHSYESGWKGASVIPDPPVPGAMQWLADLCDPLLGEDAMRVVVCSARASRPWGWWAIRRWLLRRLIEHFAAHTSLAYDIYDSIKVTSTKPAASVYVDDRAWRFDGVKFPTSVELRNHRPWCDHTKQRIV